MRNSAFKLVALILLIFGLVDAAMAQIVASFPPTPFSCLDDEVDVQAACTRVYFCTMPPNPISEFTIGAFAFKTCPNQPVNNVARVDASLGGLQAAADAKAISLFFGRRIKEQLTVGDCNGKSALLIDFDDPQGCNPPPPPLPPEYTGCNNVGGDGFNPVDGGAGSDGCSPSSSICRATVSL